jgi:CDGSH-type Zn-finger protein
MTEDNESNSPKVVAGNRPIGVPAEAGQSYWWCACGRSAGQPFCDGSHKGTGVAPLELRESEEKTVWLCTCKLTRNPPYCDGSHKHLPAGTAVGDALPRIDLP